MPREGAAMLNDVVAHELSERDRSIYEGVVPPDHFLRKALQVVPWDDFLELLAPYYSADKGRPADYPVMMLKLEFLRYQYNLSDREVIARATTDLAFRHFLQFPLWWKLPDPSSLCIFRGRLGKDGFRKVFDQVVATAREYGVVKDRLRIKDATHVIANIAIPSALALVAQSRDKLLAAAEPFAQLLVEGERIKLDSLRETTKALPSAARLAMRVAQLQDIVGWADALPPPPDAETNQRWQTFLAHRALAHKILADRADPKAGDRTVSVVDPEARCGKHGDWFEGYLVDVMIDADSEIVTAVNVLAASGDEAADATVLIRQEEEAHGNDVQALSIDGVGYNGPMLRELEDPAGLNVDTYVPPPQEPEAGLFVPKDFHEDKERNVATCPAGQTSQSGQRDERKGLIKYRFPVRHCRVCPLLQQCMKQPPARHGRTVSKTDYQAEHERVRKKASSPAYAAVRREHTKIERKLGELMNRHGGRRARSRGFPKVLIQQLMASMAMNVKRLVLLVCAPKMELGWQ
jgi:transposase